jgi:hypothetical protein
MNKIKKINKIEKNRNKLLNTTIAYIAGFLDGDGNLLVQIVKNETFKYKFQIRISIIFYQKTIKH